MEFKPGDSVIKNTGGNKMKIISCDDVVAECVWYTEKYNQSIFNIEDLIPYSLYQKVLISEKREDLIKNILEWK
jgi:uncharacterized protein YodC (DUF2158 family)